LQLKLEAFHALGVHVVALSVDPPARAARMAEQMGLTFTVVSDPDLEAIDAFDVRHPEGGPAGSDIARPATFLFAGGVLRWRSLTDNWRVRPDATEILKRIETKLGPR